MAVRVWKVALFGALPLAAAAGVSAQDQAAPLDALRGCRSIAVEAERLACYDQTAGALLAAADTGDLRVVDAEDVRETRRRLFGFSLPDLGIFGGGDKSQEQEFDELETTISSARSLGDGVWLFQTTEGATWRIANAPSRLKPIRAGQSVVFKRAAMGTYFIRIDGQLGVKGRRIE